MKIILERVNKKWLAIERILIPNQELFVERILEEVQPRVVKSLIIVI